VVAAPAPEDMRGDVCRSQERATHCHLHLECRTSKDAKTKTAGQFSDSLPHLSHPPSFLALYRLPTRLQTRRPPPPWVGELPGPRERARPAPGPPLVRQ
jgi:hypothetical protein